ncbi:MAG: hypothetical protein ABIS03_08420 [Gemmatimonadaceae bacterium]
MHHPKLLRSKLIRSAMIPAALLCVTASGCADQQPTGPTLRVAQSSGVAYNKFFTVWSLTYKPTPFELQVFALDPRQIKQYAEFADAPTLAFARAYPGRLYIHSDEPDQYCIAPSTYAQTYHAFVANIRSVDPSAKFSPAGVAEPNARCCPEDDQACKERMHSVGYMQQFYDAYVQRYGVAPSVDEWRFHEFGIRYPVGDLALWWERIDKLASWSVAHGGTMALGSWGFLGWKVPEPEYLEYLKKAMGRLINDPRITEATYWSYEQLLGNWHYLINPDGSLTGVGKTYLNPLTDVPYSLKMASSASGQARLEWYNPTAAWAADVEFWVQGPTSSSFVYSRAVQVAGPGAEASPVSVFNIGDRVKGRVRYSNAYGKAEWSSFSDAVLIELDQGDVTKKPTSRKGALYCFLSKRIQSEPCE